MKPISYKKRRVWKYRLKKAYGIALPFILARSVSFGPITLLATGLLKIGRDYAWDGPSGPAIDTKSFMRGSLVHDALYQLIREGVLDSKYRKAADEILRTICIEDGMSRIRAWWVYQGVRLGGKKSTQPNTLHAP